ncbi:hypothetical protein YN1_4340 [Nanoarchaeota archaeon]
MEESFIEKYIDKNQNLSIYILIIYILFYIFLLSYYLFNYKYFLFILTLGLLYLPILWSLLKYSKTNMIKFVYILVPIEIFFIYNSNYLLIYYLTRNIFLFIIFYLIGNYIAENGISINYKSLIFYLILIIYLFFIYFINYYNLFSLSLIIFLIFLVNYLNDIRKFSMNILNKINDYKEIIFIILPILFLVQVVISIFSCNIFYTSIVSIFTLIEFLILYLIKKIFYKKNEGFTMYFLIIFIFLFLFFTQIFFITNNNIIYYLQTILLSIIFYFTAIHAFLYHRFPDKKKILLGIISGVPLLIINLITFLVYYISPNIYLRIILFTIDILIFGTMTLVLNTIHILYKNPI